MMLTYGNIKKAVCILIKKVNELSEGDVSELKNRIKSLELLISEEDNPTEAIDKFNEIISFLESIPNTLNLVEILNLYALTSDIVLSDWNQNDTEAKDYIKNKPNIAEALIQSDWEQTNVESKDYIKNKPTIPTVPTNVSEFNNDAGYLTQHLDISGKANTADLALVATSGSYNDLNNLPIFADSNGYEFVDLGLPSGTLWAKYNIGALSETDYGNYYMWGKGAAQYNSSDSIYEGNYSLDVDTARQVWGGDWRMPTQAQFTELINNTTSNWVTINNIQGMKFTAANGNYVFFPSAGYNLNGNMYDVGSYGSYWSATREKYNFSYHLAFNSGSKYVSYYNKGGGLSVRPIIREEDKLTLNEKINSIELNISEVLVQADWELDDSTAKDYIKNKPTISNKADKDLDAVEGNVAVLDANGNSVDSGVTLEDLGIILPDTHDYVEIGGLYWAKCNIGAESETDYGLYFQWGDIQGYTASEVGSSVEGKKYFNWGSYKYATSSTNLNKYNSSDGLTTLLAEDDAVQAAWGGSWRMPTTYEFRTLSNATTSAWTDDYEGSGVAGLVFTSNADSSKKLFFPAAGYCLNGSVLRVGSLGDYWSSSLNRGNVLKAYFLYFDNGYMLWQDDDYRWGGRAVRGVSSVEPTETKKSTKVNKEDLAAVATSGNYNDLSNKPNLFSGSYNDLSNKPALFSGNYNDLTNKPTLFSGNYNDLTNKPNIPAELVQSDWNQTNSTSKDYIKNKPNLSTLVTKQEYESDTETISAALNKLNSDIQNGGSSNLSLNYAPSTLSNSELEPAANDSIETAISKLHKAILDNESVVARALDELYGRIETIEQSLQ